MQAGDYLLVWGEPVGSGGYLDAETLDGRRGLVPSHFAQRLIGKNYKMNTEIQKLLTEIDTHTLGKILKYRTNHTHYVL